MNWSLSHYRLHIRRFVMGKTEDFLRKHMLTAASVDTDKTLDFVLSEMKKGLEDEESSSLRMIATYVQPDVEIVPGASVIVLDAGGTNFRTCLVTFDENRQPVISDFRKVGMPGVKSEVSAAEFFSILADNVERLIDKSDRIGFCFSYAATITEDHDGIPLVFSKEIKAPEVIGMPLGKNLLKELEKRGHDVSKKKVAIVNDTVATLLAAKAGRPDYASSYVGFILGTGTNTAYIEDNENIKKISIGKGRQIINVESGCLALELGDLDKKFVNSTKDPNSYWFEKKISGAYIGPFSACVIEEAIAEGILSKTFAERYKEIEPLNTTRMSNYLEMCHNSDYDLVRCVEGSEEDATALYKILKSIIERAGKLTAINLTAAVLASGEGKQPRDPVVINADGTTFYKTEFLEFYTRLYLDEILEKKHGRYYEIVQIDNSPTLGAAIAGLAI